ncbi:MAG TPA: hypothetical protein PLA90_15935, partial [Candidatus Sumerlaeota bacterium]|nr:hypothetical protein [Candidatus Sumerlaeota bacterium]
MRYIEFAAYNVVGGVLWVSVLTLLGYFFGNFEVVQKNFSMVIMAIIVISVLPMVIEYWRHRKDPKEEPDSGAGESA